VVVKPTHEEEIRRVLQAANQNRLAVVPRGAGTNIRGATVKESCVVIDMRRFDALERLDVSKGIATVGAGMTITRLNELLSKHNLYFPLVPENPMATLGGLVSQNHVTEESNLFGDYRKLVAEVECFDGLGRYHVLKGQEVERVVGWEGTMGIIVKLKLKVYPRNHRVTLNIYAVKDAAEAGQRLERLKNEKGVLMIEYFDAATSTLVGLERGSHLVVAYANDRGSYKDPAKIGELLDRRKRLEQTLWNDGYTLSEEASLDPSKALQFEQLCVREKVPCYGHLARGVLLTALKAAEQRSRVYSGVVSLGGKPVGKHGYGRLKREYVPVEVRRQAVRLKEERDYNHILNPGVIV
jgi:FAD/FMN-containing dehydrogenase